MHIFAVITENGDRFLYETRYGIGDAIESYYSERVYEDETSLVVAAFQLPDMR